MNKFLTSSLGKKTVMATTGLFLCLFLLNHLYTNLLIYFGDGGEKFNEASHSMVTSIIIRIVEVVLFLAIVLHVAQAILLTKENKNARPIGYANNSGVSKNSSWFSRNMGLTGSIIFFFIVVHLYNFFVPYRLTGHVVSPGMEGEKLAEEVAEALGNPIYAGLYLISVTFLAFHLNHGFQSAFHSLGLNTKGYAPLLNKVGTLFSALIWVGYASFPILFFIAEQMDFDLLNWNH